MRSCFPRHGSLARPGLLSAGPCGGHTVLGCAIAVDLCHASELARLWLTRTPFRYPKPALCVYPLRTCRCRTRSAPGDIFMPALFIPLFPELYVGCHAHGAQMEDGRGDRELVSHKAGTHNGFRLVTIGDSVPAAVARGRGSAHGRSTCRPMGTSRTHAAEPAVHAVAWFLIATYHDGPRAIGPQSPRRNARLATGTGLARV
ncbi:hypothetical protein BV25DRAFT_11449 [Artomyces pyxidatus]|uniref:Uncharacterized protein n=1 Tax=Artomyces pyxidatus TaxID=48021 RepID=A0ACB8TJI0_9AGAM|nr:hypothetical protein BV25DRAFT_11449 [Artomyces pyxidatus]